MTFGIDMLGPNGVGFKVPIIKYLTVNAIVDDAVFHAISRKMRGAVPRFESFSRFADCNTNIEVCVSTFFRLCEACGRSNPDCKSQNSWFAFPSSPKQRQLEKPFFFPNPPPLKPHFFSE